MDSPSPPPSLADQILAQGVPTEPISPDPEIQVDDLGFPLPLTYDEAFPYALRRIQTRYPLIHIDLTPDPLIPQVWHNGRQYTQNDLVTLIGLPLRQIHLRREDTPLLWDYLIKRFPRMDRSVVQITQNLFYDITSHRMLTAPPPGGLNYYTITNKQGDNNNNDERIDITS